MKKYDVWLGGGTDELNAAIKALDPDNIAGPGDFGMHFSTDDLQDAKEIFNKTVYLSIKLTGKVWEGMRIEEMLFCPTCRHMDTAQVYPKKEHRKFSCR